MKLYRYRVVVEYQMEIKAPNEATAMMIGQLLQPGELNEHLTQIKGSTLTYIETLKEVVTNEKAKS